MGGSNWMEVPVHLSASSEWAEIAAALAQTAGGGAAVAALITRLFSLWQQLLVELPSSSLDLEEINVEADETTKTALTQKISKLGVALLTVTWEKLHSGSWQDVLIIWRDSYSLVCMCTACFEMLFGGGEVEALRCLDLAILLGGPLLRPMLDVLIDDIMLRFSSSSSSSPHCTTEVSKTHHLIDQHKKEEEQEEEDIEKKKNETTTSSEEIKSTTSSTFLVLGSEPVHAIPLPPHSLGPHGHPVPTEDVPPSLDQFAAQYLTTHTPVVISGAMAAWPALQQQHHHHRRWCRGEYWVAVAGPRTVPVEIGESYVAEGFEQRLMLFSEFLHKHVLLGERGLEEKNNITSGGDDDDDDEGMEVGKESENDDNVAVIESKYGGGGGGGGAHPTTTTTHPTTTSSMSPIGALPHRNAPVYLAQHDLLSQIPALRQDVMTPEYCFLDGESSSSNSGGGGGTIRTNVWIGPSGTITPPHTDPYQNLLCQVVGRKYARLYNPLLHSAAMYPADDDLSCNTSCVDVDCPDEQQHPLFLTAPFYDCVLEAGQMLYIPQGWWHYVKALTSSVSVNYWWK